MKMLLLMLPLVALVSPGLSSCSLREIHNTSATMALAVTDASPYIVKVKVFSTVCPGLDTEGPSTYRLDVLGSARYEGYFGKPFKSSAAIVENQGIVFTADAVPRIAHDLPRNFTWYRNQQNLPTEMCFRLVATIGENCEEVLYGNCTDELLQEEINSTGSEPTPAAPTTVASQTPISVPPTVDPAHEAKCHHKYNCTGKGGKGVCGSDGMWYKNLCSLRYHRCVYNILTLQRDREQISCIGVPKPDFSKIPPPTVPPPTASEPPTQSSQPCFEEVESLIKLNVTVPYQCRYDGYYRPVQCWEDKGAIECICYNVRTGSGIEGTAWHFDCATEPSPFSPMSHCNL